MPSIHELSPFQQGWTVVKTYLNAPFGRRWLSALPYDTPERLEQGLVIVLPGIEGVSALNHSLVHGLVDANVPYAVRLHDWTLRMKPGMLNLWLTLRSRQAAARIVEMIVDYQDQNPGMPVHLIGHSGGAALVPYVLEELPPQRAVQSGIMIAPALSPRYLLDRALKSVSGKMYNIRSPWDWYFLGVGTSVVGTLDRQFGRSAGNVGFEQPAPEQGDLFRLYQQKFVEIAYNRAMLKVWHYGGHFSCMNRLFVARHISPLLEVESPAVDVIPLKDRSCPVDYQQPAMRSA